jgi:hypothetical protein
MQAFCLGLSALCRAFAPLTQPCGLGWYMAALSALNKNFQALSLNKNFQAPSSLQFLYVDTA